MFSRYACPFKGAAWSQASRIAGPAVNRPGRSLHQSVQQRNEGASNGPTPANTLKQPQTRRTRNNAAASQVADLGRRQVAPRGPGNAQNTPTSRPPYRRANTQAPPTSKFVKAPENLRLTRNATAAGVRGPNLRGRSNSSPAGGRPKPIGRAGEAGPKKRSRKIQEEARAKAKEEESVSVEDTLSDGMVQHLLRLQRKEWDRVPYQPMYTHGSKAATSLVEDGKKLFQGETPHAKKPGRLEKTIGIAGMHGA